MHAATTPYPLPSSRSQRPIGGAWWDVKLQNWTRRGRTLIKRTPLLTSGRIANMLQQHEGKDWRLRCGQPEVPL